MHVVCLVKAKPGILSQDKATLLLSDLQSQASVFPGAEPVPSNASSVCSMRGRLTPFCPPMDGCENPSDFRRIADPRASQVLALSSPSVKVSSFPR